MLALFFLKRLGCWGFPPLSPRGDAVLWCTGRTEVAGCRGRLFKLERSLSQLCRNPSLHRMCSLLLESALLLKKPFLSARGVIRKASE